jgi:hypothetical protein
MSYPFLEIILPVSRDVKDEDAFKSIQSSIRVRFIPPPNRKRILVIAMELFQNLKRHSNHNHLALLRIRKNDKGDYVISSINFADSVSTGKLAGKHSELTETRDYRRNFREKLEKKMSSSEPPGNLGLDLCFRNSSMSRLRLFPYSEDLSLIYLSFTLNDYGKICA